MPLPKDVVKAKKNMDRAEAEMGAYLDSGEHDADKHRGLVGNLERAIQEYLTRIISLRKDLSH
jgi:hypothetical protein